MTIGETIKKLRHEHGYTQEQLAEFLNISASAVSQWETDRVTPDLTQIPLLADLFEVSADVLLGIDVGNKQRRITELYQQIYETARTGEHPAAIQMLEEGLKKYPESCQLMELYISEVYLYCGLLEYPEQYKDRLNGYIDWVLSHSTDNRTRYSVISIACRYFADTGRETEAIALAESLPYASESRSQMLYGIYKGTKKYEILREIITGDYTYAVCMMGQLAEMCYDNGTPVYSEDEQVKIYHRQLAMLDLFFEQGDSDLLFFAQGKYYPNLRLAEIYAEHEDIDGMLHHLKEAAQYAQLFDTYDENKQHTSLLARNMVSGGIYRPRPQNTSYDMMKWLEDEKFDFVRHDKRYQQIYDKVRQTAEGEDKI